MTQFTLKQLGWLLVPALVFRLINLWRPELRLEEQIRWLTRLGSFSLALPLNDIEASQRLLSVLLGLIVIGLWLLLVVRWRLGLAGAATAVLLAFSPIAIQTSQDARPTYLFLLCLLLLVFVLWTWSKQASIILLISIIVTFITVGRINQINTPAAVNESLFELATFLTTSGQALTVGLFLEVVWLRWVWLVMLATAVFGWHTLRQSKPSHATGFALWIMLPIITLFLLQYNDIVYETVSVILIVPPFFYLLTTGVIQLWNKKRWQKIGAGLILALLLCTMVWGYAVGLDPNRIQGYAALAEKIEQLPDIDTDALLLSEVDDASLEFYVNKQIHRSTPALLEDRLLEETAVYVISESDPDFITPFLDQAWLRVWREKYGRFTLSHYTEKSLGAPGFVDVPHQLGEQIVLNSYHLTLDDGPLMNYEIGKPSTLRVNLFWSTETAVDQSYTTFVQLLDANGMLVSQHDGIPQNGNRPTFIWEPGEIILDVHELAIPETASPPLTVIAGMYQSETVERLIFDTGSDTLIIGSMEVGNR